MHPMFSKSALLLAALLGLAPPALANVYVVSNANDSGFGSLRQAIGDANTHAGADSIVFMIGGSKSIKLQSELPAVTDALDINGESQLGPGGSLQIELDGTSAGAGATGLFIAAGPTQVHGLVINRFAGRGIYAANCSNLSIYGNYIGTDAGGTIDLGNGQEGIFLTNTPGAIVGGNTAPKANLVSGNASNGITVSGGNLVQIVGNLIGTKAGGMAALGNDSYGVRVLADLNFVNNNIISGNQRGLSLEGNQNVAQGNTIGLNKIGSAAIPNQSMGIDVDGDGNFIGGSTVATRNLISGNGGAGIYIRAMAKGTTVVGNFIGTNAAGSSALGNTGSGVRILGSGSFIGSNQPEQSNLVSGNGTGISVEGDNNLVQGNVVGLNLAKTGIVANGTGISVAGKSNTIGGSDPSANLVSGNTGSGIVIATLGTGNAVDSNRVGTNAAGTAAFGNGGAGIWAGGPQNTVTSNLVSGNYRGIYVSAPSNVIQSNRVGTKATGQAKLPNTAEGIFVTGAAADNLIGGPGAGNLVAGNGSYGIFVYGNGAGGTMIQGNFIGSGFAGEVLGNYQAGIALFDAFDVTIGGSGPDEGNVIANNGWVGVDVFGGTGNSLLANSIHDNASAGIELQPPLGPMANDPGDADFGSNDLQNYPVLSAALQTAGGTHIEGKLGSAPLDAYRVELFANSACDASGMGEGRTFLGAIDVLTDAMGNAVVSGDVASTNLAYVSATATSSSGDTSEFSPCVLVGGPNPGQFQFGMNPFLAYEELGQVTITVTRSGGSSGAASVQYTTVNDTAQAPGDFTATSGTLTFADGEVVKTFTVPLQLDASGEGTETFKVLLSAPTGGAQLGAQSVADVMLFDYELSFPGTFVSGGTITEGNSGTKDLAFTVTVTPTNVPVVVALHTVDGSAKAGSDYDAKTFQLTFQPGDAPKTILVPIHGDTAIEGNEVFYVEVTSVSLGSVSGHGEGVILDDDGPAAPLCVGGTDIVASRVTITGLDGPPSNQKISFAGKMLFPAGAPAGTTPLDMAARGAQLRIEDLGSGKALLDSTQQTTPIPTGAAGQPCAAGATDGWTGDAAHTYSLYRNQSGAMAPACAAGSAHGLKRVRLDDLRVSRGKIRISGRAVTPVAAPTGDVRLTLVLGADSAAGLSGACGQHTIAALKCIPKQGGTKIVCK